MKEDEIILIKRIRTYLQDVWEHEKVVPYDWQIESHIIEYFANLTQSVLNYLLSAGVIVNIQGEEKPPKLCLTSFFSEVADKLNLFSNDKE